MRNAVLLVAVTGLVSASCRGVPSKTSPSSQSEEGEPETEEKELPPDTRTQPAEAKHRAPETQPSDEVRWSEEPDWREVCPTDDSEVVEFAPTFIVDDLASLYEPLYGDFMDRYGEWGATAPKRETAERRSIVCEVVQNGPWPVLEDLRMGKLGRTFDGACRLGDDESVSFDRFSYRLFDLGEGRYAVVRTARQPGNNFHEIKARLDHGFVVALVTTRSFRCELDREDPCRMLERGDGSSGMTCFDDQTACVESGFNTNVVLTNPRTGRHVESGYFHRRALPTVVVDGDQAMVSTEDCVQRLALP